MSKPHEKRRRKLIRPGLQLKLIGAFCGVASIAFLVQVLLLGYRLSDLATRMPEGGAFLASEVPRLLGEVGLLTVAVLLPVTLLAGIPITFRIAGPLYRFQVHLEAVARGEDPGACRIRRTDELQELCVAINDALDVARGDRAVDGPSERSPSAAAEDDAEPRRRTAVAG